MRKGRRVRRQGQNEEEPQRADCPSVDWTAAVAASESPEYLEALWLSREEAFDVWGSRRFDHELNQLDGTPQDAALEIRLIREPGQAVCRAKLEVRTSLALFPNGGSAADVKHLVNVIGSAQRQMARRWRISFPAARAAKPYVVTDGRRGLLRAYGERSAFAVIEAAALLLPAYRFVATVWRASVQGGRATTVAEVRRIAEHALAKDNMDVRVLFAIDNNRIDDDGRPTLDDKLIARVGLAVGCRIGTDGRYQPPSRPIVLEKPLHVGLLRMVAEDLAPRRGVDPESLLRKTLLPMADGQFNGPIVRYTSAEARATRFRLRKRQARPRPTSEK